MITHIHSSWMASADEPYNRSRVVMQHLPSGLAALRTYMRKLGISAKEAPPIPPTGLVDAFIHAERYRVLVQYDPFPVTGVEDEPDANGEPIYIIGDPCWHARVDTLAE